MMSYGNIFTVEVIEFEKLLRVILFHKLRSSVKSVGTYMLIHYFNNFFFKQKFKKNKKLYRSAVSVMLALVCFSKNLKFINL